MAGTAAAQSASGLRAMWQSRFERWLRRRLPPAPRVRLHHRHLFILPTRAGFYLGLCAALILLTAINYQNNMGYALASLLLALFLVAIAHTYRNLSGLALRAGDVEPVFAGRQADFTVYLDNPTQRPRFSIVLYRRAESVCHLERLEAQGSGSGSLTQRVSQRGWHRPGRLCIETRFPLGLLRCWSLVDLDQRVLVYPAPRRFAVESVPSAGDEGRDSETARGEWGGGEEFEGLRRYHRGDPLKYLHWKSLAKGQPLQTRYFVPVSGASRWLDWDHYPSLDVESRLSHLCALVLECSAANISYGLRLPGVALPPDSSERHRMAALRALALFDGAAL